MGLSVSIRNVPEDVMSRLRERARRHHRSLQGELVAILEETVFPRRLSVSEARSQVRDLGLATGSNSASLIREDRDAR